MNLTQSVVLSLWAATALLHGAESGRMTLTMTMLAALAGAGIVVSPPMWLRVLARPRAGDRELTDRVQQALETVCRRTGTDRPTVRLVPGRNATFTRTPWGTRTLAVGREWARQMEHEQLIGIVAHELGHDRDDHLWHHAATNAGGMLLAAATALVSAAVVVSYRVLWLDRIHELPEPVGFLALVAVATTAARLMWEAQIARPASRRHEWEADAFAIEHGFGPQLAAALSSDHLPRAAGPPWWSTHPAPEQRIAACRAPGQQVS